MVQKGFIDTYLFVNQKLQNINSYKDLNDDNYLTIYEVFRVIGGKALFLNEHLLRLKQSLTKSAINFQVPELSTLNKQISDLCQANDKHFGNVELTLKVDRSNNITILIGFIPHHYPAATAYLTGIETKTLVTERSNPTIKIKNTEARKQANAFIAKHQLHEVLLQNYQGYLTEGSRSNLFLIKENTIFTAPENLVLPGITRLRTIQLINNLQIKLIQEPVHINDLSSFEAAFICGTSPGILPINKINEIDFNVNHPVLRMLIENYNTIINNYLKDI